MKRIFVDTSFWYALTAGNDANHGRSALFARQCQAEGALLYTSVLVLAELQRLIMYCFGIDAGRRCLRQILRQEEQGLLRVLDISTAEIRQAEVLLNKSADHDLSLTDACSAVLIGGHRLDQIASYDWHFRLLGLETVPE